MIRPLSLFVFCAYCSLLSSVLNGANHGPVSSAKSFSEVLKRAQAGDTIIIADGRYEDWSVELDITGTAEIPITLRSESPKGATFSGVNHFNIVGSFLTLSGFIFDKCKLDQNLLE